MKAFIVACVLFLAGCATTDSVVLVEGMEELRTKNSVPDELWQGRGYYNIQCGKSFCVSQSECYIVHPEMVVEALAQLKQCMSPVY